MGDYESFQGRFLSLSGIDLTRYKEKQMRRRIEARIERLGYAGYEEYLIALENGPSQLAAFIDYITINVTEFFRTPEHWKTLSETILPKLTERFGKELRIWSAGCSTGEEPYSLAMALLSMSAPPDFKITATDIDERVLSLARTGEYAASKAESVPEALRTRFFTQTEHGYRIKDFVRERVEFRKADITRDAFPDRLHLIVCRNLLIYLTDDAKEKVFRGFRDSLLPGGCLFRGKAEQIVYYKNQGLSKPASGFYFKN
ncbi:MAG: protein-glutamate O-methyltransferase CheR [Clostridia bacterium]|nr:protein-glutamate O-methyltransferase CheR [Clostridia bacterium]